MSSHLILPCAMTCCLWTAAQAGEGTSFLDRPIDVRIRARTLDEAITTLAGYSILAAAIAEDPALAVSEVHFRSVTLREALDALCTERRLRWRVLDGELVVDRPLVADAEIELRRAAKAALTAREPMAWARVLDRVGGSGDLRAVAIAIDGLLSSHATIRQLTGDWLDFGWCCLFFDPAWGKGIGLCDDPAGLARLLAVYRRADTDVRPILHRLLREASCREAVPVLRDELAKAVARLRAGDTDRRIDVAWSLYRLAGPTADDLLWEWWSASIERDRAARWPNYEKGDGSYLKSIGAGLAIRGDAARREEIAAAWEEINTTGKHPNAWGSFDEATAVRAVPSEQQVVSSVASTDVGRPKTDRLVLPTAPAAGSADPELWRSYYRALAENRSATALDRLKQHALDGSPEHRAAMGTLIAIPCPQAEALWNCVIERFETGAVPLREVLDICLELTRDLGARGASPRQLLPLLRRAIASDRAATRACAQELIGDWLGWPLNTQRAFADLDSVAEMADLLVASTPKSASKTQREEILDDILRGQGWLPAGSAVAYLTIHRGYPEPKDER